MKIKAAVFRKVHEPLTIETVELDRPRGREILVHTVATGVCHSDLHVVDGLGRYPIDRPFVLGHEGAGVVEAVGDDVSAVQVGDHVVACLSGFCGTCPQCLSGHPNVCTGGIVTRPETGTPRVSQDGGSAVSAATPRRCCCTKIPSCGSIPTSLSTGPRWWDAAY
jgi:S-(hydroxymethyl)glutathione dehydrogenase/alcohol dehydrogenase